MTYDAAKSTLMQSLPDGLEAGATKGTLGITTFIKRELVGALEQVRGRIDQTAVLRSVGLSRVSLCGSEPKATYS